MRRIVARVFAVVILSALALVSIPSVGRAAEPDMAGVWKGVFETDDGPANLIITIKQSGAKYSGTISMPEEKLNTTIRTAEMDDEFFAISGVLPVQTQGQTVQVHITLGGFVDGDSEIWEGTWTMGDKSGNVLASNMFSVERAEAGQKPVASKPGGIVSSKPPTSKENVGGLVGTKKPKPADTPKKQTSTPPKPKTGSSSDAKAGAMAGTWSGTYVTNYKTTGTLTVEVEADGDSYSGSGSAVDEDGTEIPPMTFTGGEVSGKKFTLEGMMTAITEDGEEVPASVSMSGNVTGDSWRGTLMVMPEGEDVGGLNVTFRLEREAAAPPPPAKPATTGGGMSGRGKVSK